MMHRLSVISLACGMGLACSINSYGTDLLQVYQQAALNNATYQAAQATYKATQQDTPIARGELLPQILLTGNVTHNYQSVGSSENYHSNALELALTQNVFNFGVWQTYTQAQVEVKQAAISYAQAQQTLIQTVSTHYFNLL